MKLLILSSIVVLCLVDYANAACNTCGVTSKVACFSQTQYFACNSASQVDVSVLMTCTTGFCTDTIPPCSSGPAICQTAVAPIITTIAPVTTTTTIAPVTTTTTIAPVTTTTTIAPVTTTTTIAPVAPIVTVTSATATAWCANKTPGRYAQPGDTTCTNYVYCYLNGGIMGWVYSCVGTTLFNPKLSTCQLGYTCV